MLAARRIMFSQVRGTLALSGYGTAVASAVTSTTVTLNTATLTGDTIVVMLYTTAATLSSVTVSGCGATWAVNFSGDYLVAVGASPTAGSTTVTVSYPFAVNFTVLAASFAGASTRQWTTLGSDSVTPATIDVLKSDPTLVLNSVPPGTTGTPTAGQGAVIGWEVEGVTTATSSFTDTNGTYAQVPVVASGNGVTVEMGWAIVPTSGGTNHVGNRSDSPTVYRGAVLVFDHI